MSYRRRIIFTITAIASIEDVDTGVVPLAELGRNLAVVVGDELEHAAGVTVTVEWELDA